MKVKCLCCGKEFEPEFFEDDYEIKVDERYKYNPETVEDESCVCPYCNTPNRRSELDAEAELEGELEEMRSSLKRTEEIFGLGKKKPTQKRE